jgi:glycerol-3-phosphate dehydrogenase
VDGAVADASERTWLDAAELETEVVSHLVEIYGSEAATVVAQRRLHDNAMERIHPDGPDVWAQAFHAIDREWATTVDNIVRRRIALAVRGLATSSVRTEIKRRTAVTA